MARRRGADRRVEIGLAARTGLATLGPVGRSALFGLALSAVAAVVLGFLIPRAVERSLLRGETELLTTVAESAKEVGLLELLAGNLWALPPVESFLDDRLLGGRTVRVKIIDRTGTIVYSDLHSLIGQRFPLSEAAEEVFAGAPNTVRVDYGESENQSEAGLGPLIEFILPVEGGHGPVVGLFEIYESAGVLAGEVSDVRRTVWIAIGSGLGIAALFTALLTIGSGRQAMKQFQRAEELLAGLLTAEEGERKRVVGALHNEVGQPLYRILFGLQATRRRLGEDHPAALELAELERLGRSIDKTLRSEFNVLYRPSVETATLSEMIEGLVKRSQEAMSARIFSEVDLESAPTAAQAEAIYRAAEEALTNVRHHAHAGSVWLRLVAGDGRLTLTVEDDGVGGRVTQGLGLVSTRERLEAIGGGLTVGSRPTVGTLVTAWVPFPGDRS